MKTKTKTVISPGVKHLNSDILPRGLPVEAVLADLQNALVNNACAVLQAPPGAGKTTCIPLRLLRASWLEDRKIILLAPRRLAARAAAMRMANLLNEKLDRRSDTVSAWTAVSVLQPASKWSPKVC